MIDVGYIPLNNPVSGVWPFPDFPLVVVIDGARFAAAEWEFPYPGVVAQYREDVDYNAKHLTVSKNGSYTIDHIDEANPDKGHVWEHATLDVAPTPAGVAIIASAAILITIAIVRIL